MISADKSSHFLKVMKKKIYTILLYIADISYSLKKNKKKKFFFGKMVLVIKKYVSLPRIIVSEDVGEDVVAKDRKICNSMI